MSDRTKAVIYSLRALAVSALIVIGIAAALKAVVAASASLYLPYNLAVALGCIMLMVGGFFLVFMHELGHAIIAVALGWKLRIFNVGRFSVRLTPARALFGIPVFGLYCTGAVYVEPPQRPRWRLGSAAISAAGPLIEIAFAVIAAHYALEAPHESLLEAMLWVFAAIALFDGIRNLVPRVSPGGHGTDGAHLLAALFDRNYERHELGMRVFGEIAQAKRPRDWDAKLAERLRASAVWARGEAQTHLYLAQWHRDRGESSAARTALERAKDLGGADEEIRIEDAFLAAYEEGDGSRARRILKTLHSYYALKLPSYWRTRCAIALALHEPEEALESYERACKAQAKWILTTAQDEEILEELGRRVSALPVPRKLVSVQA
ncbi:MAG: tetratricopeptide repeat protein [Proteobacteria bacterium]|nr:tetratricopeptide repeat protein [Pseudomonadota bacterium]